MKGSPRGSDSPGVALKALQMAEFFQQQPTEGHGEGGTVAVQGEKALFLNFRHRREPSSFLARRSRFQPTSLNGYVSRQC